MIVQIIELTKPPKETIFGIYTCFSKVHQGLMVSGIVPDSATSLDGRLQRGDHIIRVNALNIAALPGKRAYEVFLKEMQTKTKVRLVVARPFRVEKSETKIVPSNILEDDEALENYLVAGNKLTSLDKAFPEGNVQKNDASRNLGTSIFTTDNAILQTIELSKPVLDMKFGGATHWAEYHVGLRVCRIDPGSLIHHDGRMQIGDYIIRINGHNLAKMVGKAAQEVFDSVIKTSNKVTFVVARPIPNGGKIVPSNILLDEEEVKKYLK
ncbi:Patj [Folsomia candida]|uniref:Patj n=2 Tax=Folsomia candida TaxID=158441 RepID=A0A226D4E7_FOLCA|nr:Patj [Folsomia candida]